MPEVSDQATIICNHCNRDIPSSNIDLHYAHCSRNLEKCKVCSDMVPRKYAEEHFLSTHAPVSCSLCSQSMEREVLAVHKGENCPQRIVTCEYCEFPLPAVDLFEHQEVCGNRTELCNLCSRYIRLRERSNHEIRCNGVPNIPAEPSRNTRETERERGPQRRQPPSRVPAEGSIYEESNVRRSALSMAKRRVKKNTKKTAASPASDVCGNEPKDSQVGKKEDAFKDQEVERQITAIRTIRDVEIERLLTGLRLLRSYFSKDQLQIPVQQFFKDNLPNLAVVRNVKDGKYEVQWKEKDGNLSMNQADGGNIHASLLHQMSMAFPNCSATMPSLGGCGFSSNAVKSSLLGGDNLKIRDFILEEPSETQMHGLHDFLQTPGACDQRLSVGMTPKTLRVPKHGEMLLSVHGSPLGVYKEENMDAIHEAEEG